MQSITQKFVHLIWFRRDLRLQDNECVSLAGGDNQLVLPFFIIDPWFYKWDEVGQMRVKFMFQALEDLDNNLRERGGQLYLFEGNAIEIITNLTAELRAQNLVPKLFFNRDVQVTYGVDRDSQAISLYQNLNLPVHIGSSSFLKQDESEMDQWRGQYYTYQAQPTWSVPEYINCINLS